MFSSTAALAHVLFEVLVYCYAAMVQVRVTINDRGAITIPATLRRAFGLVAGEEFIVEVTEDGLLLRPSMTVPVEFYSEERIKKFSEGEDEIAKLLPDIE